MALEQIVRNTDHHFIVNLSRICQPLIKALWERSQGLYWFCTIVYEQCCSSDKTVIDTNNDSASAQIMFQISATAEQNLINTY